MNIFKKKYSILAIIIFACSLFIYSNNEKNWALSLGNHDGHVIFKKVICDHEGNIIVGGTYSSPTLKVANDLNISNNGKIDLFILKLKPDKSILWAKSIGGLEDDKVEDIAIGKNNEIYLTGTFSSNTLHIDEKKITSSWPYNVFISKLDKNGKFVWLKHSEKRTGIVYAKAITTDTDENLYISGHFAFTSIDFGNYTLENEDNKRKSYLCKYSKDGALQWATSLLKEDGLIINDLLTDNDNNIYWAGRFIIENYSQNLYYKESAMIEKMDQDRNKLWSYIDTTAISEATSLAYSSSNNIIALTKTYFPSDNFFCVGDLPDSSWFSLLKLNTNGDTLWKKNHTGAYGYDLDVSDTNILVTGAFYGNEVRIGNDVLKRYADSSKNCAQYPDIFIADFDNDGIPKKAYGYSGGIRDEGISICKNKNGDIFLGGEFESYKINFGKSEVSNTSDLDIFGHPSGIYYNRNPYAFVIKFDAGVITTRLPITEKKLIQFYPNPSNGIVHFELPDQPLENAHVQLITFSGRVIYNKPLNNNSTINFSDIEKGCYIILFKTRDNTYHGKIMLQ